MQLLEGTTGNPKPVIWTHRALRQFALHPCYGDVDLAGKIMSIHAMGMHHGIGMLQIAFVVSHSIFGFCSFTHIT